jgi:hypothetical protein
MNKTTKTGNVLEKIKQEPAGSYESFCYKYTRKDTNKKYIGKRKGYPGDGYKHSSKNIDLADDLRNPNLSFTYEVFAYGTDDEMLDLEKKLLTKEDAAHSSDWYNKHNGFGSGNSAKTDPEEILELSERVKSGEWNFNERKSLEVLSKLPRIQVRAIDANQKVLRDRFIEKNGTIDELCDPVTLLEGRGINGEDVIIDGNTTIGAATLSKVVKELPFQTIPYDVHKNYTDKELGWFGTSLNEENEKVVQSASHEDLVKQILNECNTVEEAKSQNTRKLLKLSGKTTGDITKAINEASAIIRQNILSNGNKTLIDWESGQYQGLLENKVIANNILTDNPETSVYCHSMASGFVSISKIFQPMINACMKWEDDKGKPLAEPKLTRKNLKVFLTHNMKKKDMKKEWESKSNITKRSLNWAANKFGINLEIKEMPTDEEILV